MKSLKISVCNGRVCCQRNSQLLPLVKDLRDENGVSIDDPKIQLELCGCLGQCYKGPNILVEDLTHRTRVIKNGISPFRLKQEINLLKSGQSTPVARSTRKSLNDYLSGGF